jgi:hypothetical protein
VLLRQVFSLGRPRKVASLYILEATRVHSLPSSVCWRHGANRNRHDESTVFGLEFDMTTATQTHNMRAVVELPIEEDNVSFTVVRMGST